MNLLDQSYLARKSIEYENALGTHIKVATNDNLNYPVYDQYYFTVSIVTPLPEDETELAKMMQGISI